MLSIEELNVTLHFVKSREILNKDSNAGVKFKHTLEVTLAKHFIDNLKDEVKKGMLERAESGLPHGKAPLGYQNVRYGKKIAQVIPDDKTAPVVRNLFEMFARGTHSYVELIQMAQRFGVKISKQGIGKILHNPFYTGFFIFQGKVYEGKYGPLISKDLFTKVQLIAEERKPRRKRDRKYRSTFQGLIRCGVCGSSVTPEPIKKNKYRYYHCANNRCGQKSIEEKSIVDQVSSLLGKCVIPQELIQWTGEFLEKSLNTEAGVLRNALGVKKAHKSKVESRLDKIYDEKLDGVISEDRYLSTKQRYEEELEEINSEIQSLESDLMKVAPQSETLYGLENLAMHFKTAPDALKTQIIKVFFEKVTLKAKVLSFRLRKPFDLVFSQRKIA